MNSKTGAEKPPARNMSRVLVVAAVVAAVFGYYVWLERQEAALPDGILVSTGVLSATEIPVASAQAGTVAAVMVAPGVVVTAGTPLLRIAAPDRDHVVVAPRGGRVDRLPFAAAQRVEAGQIVAALTDLADLALVAPFRVGAAIPIGAEARLSFADFPNRAVPAKVASVVQPDGGTAEPQQGRSLTVTVEVTDTRSLALRPGMRGRVYLRIKEGAPWPARIR